MMRAISARPLVLLAFAVGSVVVAAPAPVANAVTETTQVLVTSQWGGSGCENNQKLLIANPFTGARIRNLGSPDSRFDVFNEAKPYDSNRKIVALWGGSNTSTQIGGVGVFDRVLDRWTTSFALPSNFQVGGNNAHSITVLPDGWFAVAQVGSIGGVGSGYVVLFSPTGTKGNQYSLSSAHGVEWDTSRNALYAVGYNDLRKYTYSSATHTLTQVANYDLPGTDPGGHDLRRRRNDNKYSVTTNGNTYIFDPATGSFTAMTKTDGSAVGGGVKQIDQRFDGTVEYNWYNQTVTPADTFNFLNGNQIPAQFCTNFYKAGRWLYAPGDPDFDDGGGGGTPTWSPTFTVGGGANSWWIEVYASSDVVQLDVIGANGQFFMSNLTKHSWGAFGQSPPQEMPAGTLIKLIGRRSDGASAATVTFPWLQNTNPATEPGWLATFTTHQCNSKLETTISAEATDARVRIGTADWAQMTKNLMTGRWERSPGVPLGTKYLIRAYLPTGEKAYDLIRTC